MAEHVPLEDLDREAKKLKRDLEGWREIILPLNSLLLWDNPFYPGIIVALSSAAFFLLWHIEPSPLSLISFFGIVITAIDYLVPTITSRLCNPENWTSSKERKLEIICRTLAAYKIYTVNTFRCFIKLRYDRPKTYYTISLSTLFVLSVIGNSIDNLFLSYLLVTGLLLYPGIETHGLADDYGASLFTVMRSKILLTETPRTD